MAENHRPGLPSLNEARAERRRQLATGRARVGGLPPQFFLWGGLLLVTFFVAYYRVAQSDLEKARNELMAKQRAVAQSLGPKLLPIRDKVEAAAQELRSATYPGDFVSPNLDLEKLGETPGIYLRLRLEDTADVEQLRKAATASLRDGFTSCLFRDMKATSPQEGAPSVSRVRCARSSTSASGQRTPSTCAWFIGPCTSCPPSGRTRCTRRATSWRSAPMTAVWTA